MMYNERQLKEIATKYAMFCVSMKDKGIESPFDFEDFIDKQKEYSKMKIEPKVDEIINFLNSTTQAYGKRGFQLKGKKIRSLVRTKMNEGFDTHDFFDVIKVKSCWLVDKDMHKYYRPSTLFGNKFEDYLNENVKPIEVN